MHLTWDLIPRLIQHPTCIHRRNTSKMSRKLTRMSNPIYAPGSRQRMIFSQTLSRDYAPFMLVTVSGCLCYASHHYPSCVGIRRNLENLMTSYGPTPHIILSVVLRRTALNHLLCLPGPHCPNPSGMCLIRHPLTIGPGSKLGRATVVCTMQHERYANT